jgi:hypothetical protein
LPLSICKPIRFKRPLDVKSHHWLDSLGPHSLGNICGFYSFRKFCTCSCIGTFFRVLIDSVRVKQAAKVTQFCLFAIAISFYLSFVFGNLDRDISFDIIFLIWMSYLNA